MQSINIYEKGIAYLGAVMSVYMENCAYFLLYLAGLVFILCKGDKRDKEIFIPSSILLFLTVYNPVVPFVLNKFFDVNSEYYRLLWIAPVIVLLAYVATRLIDEEIIDNGKRKLNEKALTGVLLLFIALTAGNFVYKGGYEKIENIYQIPNELIEVSQIIHSDADSEYPKAYFEYDYNMQIRQYDPKIQLTIDRDDYVRAMTEDYPQDMIEDNDNPQYRMLAALTRGQNVASENLMDALEKTKTEYVVLSKGNQMCEELKEQGLTVVSETENHVILKYQVKEPYTYELVDYSTAEHRIGFRRLK